MSCEEFRKTVSDAALGPLSPAQDSHLSGCEPCRAALDGERALLNCIDAELQGSLEIQPSLAFLPAVRRRVAELSAQREAARRLWLVPALATLTGVLVGGHFILDATRSSTTAVSPSAHLAASATRQDPAEARSQPWDLVPAQRAEPETSRGPEAAPPAARPEPAVAAPRPRVFVPAEDERAVRRLARRLGGHAGRAAVLAPEAEGPFDFTLESVEGPPALVSLDDRILRGDEPGPEEPPSFDRTFDKAGRET